MIIRLKKTKGKRHCMQAEHTRELLIPLSAAESNFFKQ
jgi:hypothetical protein